MSKTFTFSLVSPEATVASGEAIAVVVPGLEGDFTVLKDHAAMVSAVREGTVIVEDGEAKGEYPVSGGFAEVTADNLSILIS